MQGIGKVHQGQGLKNRFNQQRFKKQTQHECCSSIPSRPSSLSIQLPSSVAKSSDATSQTPASREVGLPSLVKCQASLLSSGLSPHKGGILAVFSGSASMTAKFLVTPCTKTLFSTLPALISLLVVLQSSLWALSFLTLWFCFSGTISCEMLLTL